MSDHLEKARTYHTRIRDVLMREWDPIGVAGVPEAADEYDDYVPTIHLLLIRREPAARILDYLWEVETRHMGLCGNKARTRRVAELLHGLIGEVGM